MLNQVYQVLAPPKDSIGQAAGQVDFIGFPEGIIDAVLGLAANSVGRPTPWVYHHILTAMRVQLCIVAAIRTTLVDPAIFVT